eukprot:597411_1
MLSTVVSLWCLYSTCTSYVVRNASGEYHRWTATTLIHKTIECNDASFCDLECVDCDDFTFITNSISVTIDCRGCDFLDVHAEYADCVMMNIMNSANAYFHLEHAHDINITCTQFRSSTIYAPYSHNFRFHPVNYVSNIFFYLNYVSNGIHFDYPESGSLYKSNIAAFHAKNFSFSVRGYDNVIYCPSHSENVCVIDFNSLDDMELHIANISFDFSPLTVTNGNTSYTGTGWGLLNIFCNPDEHGVYQSSTLIHGSIEYEYNWWDEWSCSDASSQCCFLNNRKNRTSIFCNDSDSHCVIHCTPQNDCAHSNIYPSDITTELYVICSGHKWSGCADTEIYCPANANSVCDVTCSDFSACQSAIVYSNTNNEHVNLRCSDSESCGYLKLFMDGIHTDPNMNYIDTKINVECYGHGACDEASFFVNAEIEIFNITCKNGVCQDTSIHAEKARNTQIHCAHDCDLNIYGESQSHNAIQLHCVTKMCTAANLKIFIEQQYELDYISVANYSAFDGGIRSFCSGEKEWPSIYASYGYRSRDEYLCDPFRDSWNDIHYCNEEETCDYKFDETEKVLIYANHARSLSILCTKQCSQISVFAQYAVEVTVRCTGDCDRMKLMANHAHSLDIGCERNCTQFMINALYSEQVLIDSEVMTSSEINALHNTDLFTLRCRTQCNDLDIVLPSYSSSHTSIECIGNNVCQEEMRIYSTNRTWNDITNLTITHCTINTTSYSANSRNWILFCPSSIPRWARGMYYNPCVYLNNMQQPFCECDWLSEIDLTDHLAGGMVIFDPFGNEACFEHLSESIEWKTFQQIFGIMIAVVVLCMICIWCIIFTKNFVLKTTQMMNIEPPSFVVLNYVYVCDAFIWVIQIYLVVLCFAMRIHYEDICSSLPLSVCGLHLNCDVHETECALQQWAIPLLVSGFALALLIASIVGVLLGSGDCSPDWVQKGIPSRTTHCVTIFIWNICMYVPDEKNWNEIIKHQYKQRTYAFWHYSKAL